MRELTLRVELTDDSNANDKMTKSFQEIKAWQYAHQLVLLVYSKTQNFPDFEKFGLRSQFTRASVSIPANIAEGYRKLSKADKLRFLNISQGSLEECRYYILLSRDLRYISEEDFSLLNNMLEKTSWYLNAYAEGISKNNALKTFITSIVSMLCV